MSRALSRAQRGSLAEVPAAGCSVVKLVGELFGALALAGLVLVGCAVPRASSNGAAPKPILGKDAVEIDGFEDLAGWKTEASDGVSVRSSAVPGVSGRALALDFDFQGHAGYAGVRRSVALDLPSNFEIALSVRGSAPPNDLQIKLLDASGDNVWWYRLRDVEPSADWQRIRFERSKIEFAWGPAQDHQLRHVAAIELVVAAGSGGGQGQLEFDELSFRALPAPPAVPPAPIASASSSAPGHAPALALDAHHETYWQSAAGGATAQFFQLDLGYAREFGGLILQWLPGAHALRYDVELSEDGQRWQLARRVSDGNGEQDALRLPDAKARFVRLALQQGVGSAYALTEVEVRPPEFGASANAFVTALASEAPRGRYPRAFSGEQVYWTLVGVDGGRDSGLLSEDGALELGRGGPSIEPFVQIGAELFSWSNVAITQSLRDGYLPIPTVTWHRPDWELSVTAFGAGDASDVALGARYVVSNRSQRPIAVRLVLAVRPFQVNPPTQALNLIGGVSPLVELRWEDGLLRINSGISGAASKQPNLGLSTATSAPPRTALVMPLVAPSGVALQSFDAADFPQRLPDAKNSAPARLEDATGLATGLLGYELRLEPRQSATLGVWAPLVTGAKISGPTRARTLAQLQATEDAVAGRWRDALGRVKLEVPPAARVLVDTLRTSLASILLSRAGPVLRPGTRSYARSWIRDGAMMSESLLRLGQVDAAREYFDWYAPHQFENGKVPCCVDARGADPVPENDSSGELIHLAAELFRFTGDRADLERAWPHVEAAARHLESLRQEQRARDASAGPQPWSGLLPPSISHEGYSDKPAYSYWDDFWGLIGYQDAAWLAEVSKHAEAHERLAHQRDEFERDLLASLRASVAAHHIPFLPGAADRGDFDPTSTTIALEPGREGAVLPHDLLLATFERYWQEFVARRAGTLPWEVYTPYEMRIAGSFLRLGFPERAADLLSFFLEGRRPSAWNQWAEVVGRDARQPRFLGDLPHAWIASDFIRALLDRFAYARERDDTLVIAAGVPASWLDTQAVRVTGLRTRYGVLDYSVTRNAEQVILEVRGTASPARFAVPWTSVCAFWGGAAPKTSPANAGDAKARASIDGVPAHWANGELAFSKLPARLVIERPEGRLP